MPKKKRNRKPAHRRGPTPARRRDEPDLLSTVQRALAANEPLALLQYASALLAVVAPTRRSPFARSDQPAGPSPDELFQSLLDVELTETSALLLALAALDGDELRRRRVRGQVLARGHELPEWLTALERAEPTGAVQLSHVLRDGDNVMVGVRLPGGHDLTVTVYIDHNLGTLVKDAVVLPAAYGEVVEQMMAVADDPDTTVTELAPADARARVVPAIELGAITIPPLESETWPGCRALVEWVVGMLPEGGTGYVRPEWDDAAREQLADRFFASSYGQALDDEDRRSLLESVLWFGTDYGPGDPLRWSPSAAEILLLDWIPRKIVAEVDFLAQAPDLLRAFVRFCHAERGVRAALTTQALEAIDEFEPAYQEIVRSPRPQGPEALIAAMHAYERGEA